MPGRRMSRTSRPSLGQQKKRTSRPKVWFPWISSMDIPNFLGPTPSWERGEEREPWISMDIPNCLAPTPSWKRGEEERGGGESGTERGGGDRGRREGEERWGRRDGGGEMGEERWGRRDGGGERGRREGEERWGRREGEEMGEGSSLLEPIIRDLKITSTSTERQKRSQNSAPVLVIFFGNSLVFSRKIITSTGFYRYCAPGASAPVVVKNQSPISRYRRQHRPYRWNRPVGMEGTGSPTLEEQAIKTKAYREPPQNQTLSRAPRFGRNLPSLFRCSSLSVFCLFLIFHLFPFLFLLGQEQTTAIYWKIRNFTPTVSALTPFRTSGPKIAQKALRGALSGPGPGALL